MGVISGTTAAIIGSMVIGAGVGVGAAAASGAFNKDESQEVAPSEGTGKITDVEAQEASKKRLFRRGVIATSVQGLGSGETLGTTKLR